MRLLGAVVVAVLVIGCGPRPVVGEDAGLEPDAGGGGFDAGNQSSPDAGGPTPLNGPLPATIDGNVVASGPHTAAQDVTVASGAIFNVAAGATLTFAPGARLIVHGTLAVAGVSGNLATLSNEAGQGRWGGIYVEQGGQLQIAFAQVTSGGNGSSGAGIYLDATSGPSSISDSTISDSLPGFDCAASATVNRLVVHNAIIPWNGPVTIRGGTPSLTDLTVDQGTTGVDAIVVYGGSPQLSHVTVRNHHCCVHITQSSAATVNSMDCDTSDVYGFMFYSSAGMTGTGSNITCGNGAYAYFGNAAINLQGNYWGGGPAPVGGGQATVIDASGYATSPISGAGAR